MKSILVGKNQNSKVYFVADAWEQKNDCVIVNAIGHGTVTNFWEFVDANPRMTKILNTEFHKYLWQGHQSTTPIHWYSMFVDKAIPVAQGLLSNVIINDDVLKRKQKMLVFHNRATDFKLARNTQVMSPQMTDSWATGPTRKIKRIQRDLRAENAR